VDSRGPRVERRRGRLREAKSAGAWARKRE
jgi:hypothetical protein